MSSIDDTQEAIDAAIAGEQPEAPEVDADETPAEEAARVYAGKFNSDDELERGYTELEKRSTQAAQEAAELRAQVEAYEAQQQEAPYDPWAQVGTPLDEQTSAQLYQQTWQNPTGMMEWAQRPEVIQQFGAQITDQVFQAWHSFAPFQANLWVAQFGASQATAADRQALEELRTTTMADINGRIVQQAFENVKRDMPDIGTYKDRVVQLMDQYPLGENDPRLASADELAKYVSELSGIARWEEFQRQQAEAAPEATTARPQAGAKARTQTRSTASAGGSVSASEQAFLDEVLAGQPGQ